MNPETMMTRQWANSVAGETDDGDSVASEAGDGDSVAAETGDDNDGHGRTRVANDGDSVMGKAGGEDAGLERSRPWRRRTKGSRSLAKPDGAEPVAGKTPTAMLDDSTRTPGAATVAAM